MMRSICLLIALVAMLACAAAPAHAQTRVALVIGNSDYENVTRLPNPSNDARALAETLDGIGFDQVTLALDLDYGDMRRTLGEFSRTAAGADIAVVYFAGHGIEVGGVNYLIPTDAALSHIDDVEFEAVALTTTLHALNRAGTLKLVILDACRNNPFVPEMELAGATRSIGRGLARVEPEGSDTLVAYAAREGTLADDGAGANSPYASALVRHLATPGLDVRLVFGRVRDEVRETTGGRQEPFTYGSLGGEQIFLASAGNGAPDPAGALSSGSAQPSAAGEAWAYVKDTDARSDLTAFIEAFPDTFFAQLAATRLARLEEAAARAGRRVALVIGNDRYESEFITDLDNARRDADAVGDALETLGYAVSEAHNVDRAELSEVFAEFVADAAGPDVELALIYYAGQGTFGYNSRPGILPVDASLGREGQTGDGLALRSIAEALASAHRPAILMFDAQVTGGLNEGEAVVGSFVSDIAGAQNFAILTAAHPGKVVFDDLKDGEGSRGPFARALVNRLDGAEVTFDSLARDIGRDVADLTGGRQSPWAYSSLTGTAPLGGASLAAR